MNSFGIVLNIVKPVQVSNYLKEKFFQDIEKPTCRKWVKMNRVSVNNKSLIIESELVGANNSVLSRWLERNEEVDCVRVLNHSFDKKEYSDEEVCKMFKCTSDKVKAVVKQLLIDDALTSQQRNFIDNLFLQQALDEGIIDSRTGEKYVSAMQGAGNERVGESIWMKPKAFEKFKDYYNLGLPLLEKLPLEKGSVYFTQCNSSTRRFEADEPDIMKTIICKDIEMDTITGHLNFVQFGKVTTKVDHLTETITDGLGIMLINSDDDFTQRAEANGVKACVHSVPRAALKIFGKRTITDMYGEQHNIDDVDLILFASSFKPAKYMSKETWHTYQQRFKADNRHFLVCKTPHIRKRHLPYQQHQAIRPTDEQSNDICNYAVETINDECTQEGAIKMLSKYQRAVTKLVPEFIKEQSNKQQISSIHRNSVMKCLQGGIPNFLKYTFCLPDILPVMQMLLGEEVTPIIGPKQVHVKLPGTNLIGKQVLVTRNPSPNLGILIRNNIDIPEKYRDFYLGSACYFSITGFNMRVLSADYDGDTVGIANLDNDIVRCYAEALIKTQKETGYKCVVFNNASPKTPYSEEGWKKKIRFGETSPVGLVVNALSTLLYHYDVIVDAKEKATILEAYVTLCIDAAKNGSNEDITATRIRAEEIMKEMSKLQKPYHIFFGKEFLKDPIPEEAELESTIEVRMPSKNGRDRYAFAYNHMSRYTKSIIERGKWNVPFESWNIPEWIDGMKLDASWRKMISGKYSNCCRADGRTLWRIPTVNNGTIDYDSSEFGVALKVYNDLCMSIKNKDKLAEALEEIMPKIKRSLAEFAMSAKELNERELVNSLVYRLYGVQWDKLTETDKRLMKEAKELLWLLYGDMILVNAEMNLGLADGAVCIDIDDDTEYYFSDDCE